MKSSSIRRSLFGIIAAVAAVSFSLPAAAEVDAAAAQALAKKSGCLKCHAVDKGKKGPAYRKIAAKYKGKPDGVDKVTKNITTAPMVKFEDGTEEEHKVIDTKDQKEIRNLTDWILSL